MIPARATVPESAQAHLKAASAYRDRGEIAPALQEVRTALKLQPDFLDAEVALGLLLQQNGQPDLAISQYQATIRRHPQSPDPHNWLGVAYLQKNKLAEAQREFRTALKLSPQYLRAYNNLGSALAQAGDIPAAIDTFRDGLKVQPANVELRLNLALALRSKGDATEATQLLQSLVKEDPQNPDLALQLAQTYRQAGDLSHAIPAVEAALDRNGEMREAYYSLAMMLREDAAARRRSRKHSTSTQVSQLVADARSAAAAGQFERAVGQLKQAVALDPDSPEAQYNLAVALWYSGDRTHAREAVVHSLELDPAFADAYSFNGMVSRESGALTEAKRNYQRALALNTNAVHTYFDLAVAYLRLGQTEAALGQFEAGLNLGPPQGDIPDLALAVDELQQAVRGAPSNAEARNTLGRLLGLSGASTSQVIQAFVEAIRLRPDFAEAHNNLGLVYTQFGDDDKAAEEFRAAVRIQPNFADAHANLGALLISSDVAESVKQLEKAVSLQPRLLKAQYNLALAYEANPDDGLAKEITTLRNLLAIEPKYPRAEFMLGKALLKSGKLTDAVQHLQAAVAADPKSGEAQYQLGLALSRSGRKDEGTVTIAKARESLSASQAEQLANLDLREGRDALQAGNTDEALLKFQRVVAARPDAPEGHYYLDLAQQRKSIEAAILSSRFSGAEELLKTYLQKDAQSSWGWYALGYTYYGERKLGESIRALAQSLQLDKTNAEAHKVLGRDLLMIGRFDAAQKEFELGAHFNPKSPEMPYNLGKLYSIQDSWLQARKSFEQALALDQSYMEAYDGLGLALESLGEQEAAIANYQKAIELNESHHGNFSAPYVNLSALYNTAGDSKTALAFARRALAVNSKSDRALYQMAKAYERDGADSPAVESLNQAISINPQVSSYFYLLANAYRRLGKVDESRKAMDSFSHLSRLSNDLEQKRIDSFRDEGNRAPGGHL